MPVMGRRALVIGGTGPTGDLDRAGPARAGLGRHDPSPGRPTSGPRPRSEVEHLHHDPYDTEDLARALEGRAEDLVVAMYGRLRRIVELTAGRAERFVSVGGVPAIRGWMNPWLHEPGRAARAGRRGRPGS